MLAGRHIALKLGWIGLKLRSQADIVTKADLQSAREAERAFFAGRPEYKSLRAGTEELVSSLQRLLERSVRASVPRIQQYIALSSRDLEAELRALGGEAPADRGGRLHFALSILDAFNRAFDAQLDGGRGGGEVRWLAHACRGSRAASINFITSHYSLKPLNNGLDGMQRLRAVFERTLPATLAALPISTMFSLRNVHDVINAADGVQPHLLAPELGMRRLVKEGVRVLRAPVEEVVDKCHTALADIVQLAAADAVRSRPELGRYSALREAVEATAGATLESLREEARRVVLVSRNIARARIRSGDLTLTPHAGALLLSSSDAGGHGGGLHHCQRVPRSAGGGGGGTAGAGCARERSPGGGGGRQGGSAQVAAAAAAAAAAG